MDAVRDGLLGGTPLPTSQDFGYELERIIQRLEPVRVSEEEIARFEWFFFPFLHQGRHSSALALHRQLARDPALFAEVIAAIYRAHSENTAEEHTTTEQETLRASVAYDLLSSWHTMPGAMPDGSIDAAVLNAWVDDAMARCIACDRQAVGEQQIGQVLACSPNGEDGVWPCAPVRDLVERIRSRDVERGISIGKFNERGVVMKAPTEGGARERAIATQYTAYAIALGITHPRTAGMLRQLAAGYERDARREADRAEQRDLD